MQDKTQSYCPLRGVLVYGSQRIGRYVDAAYHDLPSYSESDESSSLSARRQLFGSALSSSPNTPRPTVGDCGSFDYSVQFVVGDSSAKYVIQRVEVHGEIYDCKGGLLLEIDELYDEVFPIDAAGNAGGPPHSVKIPERGSRVVAAGADCNHTVPQADSTYGWIDITFRAYLATKLPSCILDSYYGVPINGNAVKRDVGGNAHWMAANLLSADLKSSKTKELMKLDSDMNIVPGSNWVDRVVSLWWYCCIGMRHGGFDYSEYNDGKFVLGYTGSGGAVNLTNTPAVTWDAEVRKERILDRGKLRKKAFTSDGQVTDPNAVPPDPNVKSTDATKLEKAKRPWGPQARVLPGSSDQDIVASAGPAALILSPEDPGSWNLQFFKSSKVMPLSQFPALVPNLRTNSRGQVSSDRPSFLVSTPSSASQIQKAGGPMSTSARGCNSPLCIRPAGTS